MLEQTSSTGSGPFWRHDMDDNEVKVVVEHEHDIGCGWLVVAVVIAALVYEIAKLIWGS